MVGARTELRRRSGYGQDPGFAMKRRRHRPVNRGRRRSSLLASLAIRLLLFLVLILIVSWTVPSAIQAALLRPLQP